MIEVNCESVNCSADLILIVAIFGLILIFFKNKLIWCIHFVISQIVDIVATNHDCFVVLNY